MRYFSIQEITDCNFYKISLSDLSQIKYEFRSSYNQLFEDYEAKMQKVYSHLKLFLGSITATELLMGNEENFCKKFG